MYSLFILKNTRADADPQDHRLPLHVLGSLGIEFYRPAVEAENQNHSDCTLETSTSPRLEPLTQTGMGNFDPSRSIYLSFDGHLFSVL